MSLSRSSKLALLVLTLWPLLYMVGFVLVVPMTGNLLAVFDLVLLLHGVTMLVVLGLLVFYAVHVFRSKDLPMQHKLLWAIGLYVGSFVAMPVYWFVRVWPEPSLRWPDTDHVVPPTY